MPVAYIPTHMCRVFTGKVLRVGGGKDGFLHCNGEEEEKYKLLRASTHHIRCVERFSMELE